MKKIYFLITMLLFTVVIFSQNIAITDDNAYTADPSAMLDVKSIDKGMLIPRIDFNNKPVSPATGLLIFVTSNGPEGNNAFYYYNGTVWIKIDDSVDVWSLTGNSSTVDGANFIGTTDNVPFTIRVNNKIAGRIEPLPSTANTFFGYEAGYSNSGGQYNTANGYDALYANTWGCSNAALGFQALYANISGKENTATGMRTLMWNTSGNYNTANGYLALSVNTTGNKNTAGGYYSLHNNVAGSNATAIGAGAMCYSNNTATAFTNYNVAVGYEALYGSTDASANTGNYNTAIGYQALWSNTSGIDNTATGYKALYSNTTGSNNIAIGNESGFTNSNGSTNVFLGYKAGYNETGSNKLYIANSEVNPPLIYGDFSTGEIGVGTTNPDKSLHIKSSGADDGIVLERASAGANTRIQFQNEGGVNQSAIIYDGTTDEFNFEVQGTSNVLRLKNNGNVGIGLSDPKSKLQVNGGVQIADDSDAASAEKVGTLRYRADSNNSYVEMCMQTGVTTYAWMVIRQNTW